jgi:hypothetical protein
MASSCNPALDALAELRTGSQRALDAQTDVSSTISTVGWAGVRECHQQAAASRKERGAHSTAFGCNLRRRRREPSIDVRRTRWVVSDSGSYFDGAAGCSRSASGSQPSTCSTRCLVLGWSLANSGGSFPREAANMRFQKATAWRGSYPALAM